MTRISLPLAALVLLAPPLLAAPVTARAQAPAASRAHADPQAEGFVQREAQKILGVLNDHGMPVEAKKAAVRSFVDQVADVSRITSFVLGKYRRTVTPAEYAAFSEAFRTYADNVYESRLGEYRGQSLKVVGSVLRQPGDVVVESEITSPRGAPTRVDWRVLRTPSGYRVVDVNIAGVWLAITEQQDFVSTLDNHNGDINYLIADLRRGDTGQGLKTR